MINPGLIKEPPKVVVLVRDGRKAVVNEDDIARYQAKGYRLSGAVAVDGDVKVEPKPKPAKRPRGRPRKKAVTDGADAYC